MTVVLTPRTNTPFVFSTARGRNAEQAGASGGLIGMLVGASVGAGEESQGRAMVRQMHKDGGHFEAQLVSEEITSRLTRSGIQLTSEADAQTCLVIDVTSVGLREAQRGFWVTYLGVGARLRKPDGGNLWSACASSTGTKQRRVEEFAANVEVYRQDLREAAEDLARQLVVGPIRR
jgi:hypothetical protein